MYANARVAMRDIVVGAQGRIRADVVGARAGARHDLSMTGQQVWRWGKGHPWGAGVGSSVYVLTRRGSVPGGRCVYGLLGCRKAIFLPLRTNMVLATVAFLIRHPLFM